MVHSDQGSQFSSYDWRDLLDEHNLQQSMSRRGNCHDNAVAESFFELLKRERIRRKSYVTREEAKQDVFDYIEMFYNPKRRRSFSNDLSPVEYEKQYFQRLASVSKTRGDADRHCPTPEFRQVAGRLRQLDNLPGQKFTDCLGMQMRSRAQS
jgi:hypothetical protein